MITHLRANLCLLVMSVILCCLLYPLVLWGLGQTVFQTKAQGSLVDGQGQPAHDETKAVGSTLIAQPFAADEYFQPRPSAASYDAQASSCSNWAASNYLLRDRVARQIGPIVKYAGGTKAVAPDIDEWFRKDRYQGQPGIVRQWANPPTALLGRQPVAQNWLHDWVKADKLNADYMAAWEKAHQTEVDAWKKDNPDPAEPKPEDLAAGLAGPFFESFSKENPGCFLGTIETKTATGSTKTIGVVKEGSDIQSLFFDMWLEEHPQAELELIPADMVTASGSGLDPHVTLANARWQLDHRVANAWADKTKGDKATIHADIEALLQARSFSPLGRLAGVPLVNVLEVNLALRQKYGK